MNRVSATDASVRLPLVFRTSLFAIAIWVCWGVLNLPPLMAQAKAPQPATKSSNTIVAKQFQAWLAAVNKGDRASIDALVGKNLDPKGLDPTLQIRAQFGGFDVRSIDESTDVRLTAVARSRSGGQLVRLTVEAAETEPHLITTIAIKPVSPASNSAPAGQLTEAQAAAARTQPPFRQFSAWLTAFNAGDAAQYKRFLEGNFPSRIPRLNSDLDFRDSSGGFELRKLEQVSATRVVGLVQERDSDQFGRFTLDVEPSEPHHIATLSVRIIQRPSEFPIAPLSEAKLVEAVKALADKNAAADRFAGAVLLAKNNKVLFSGAWGLADRQKNIPNKLDTRFRIGSMNKMFTAVAALQLVEAGKIQLTDLVGKYITDYPNKDIAAKVTVEQLLTHTGGTGDISGPEFDAHRKELRTLNDYVRLFGKRGPLFEPGSTWGYSNYGMVLLGVVIEKAAGTSYYNYVQDHIYRPAGMTQTGSLPEAQLVPGRSVGYTKSPDGARWVPNTDTLPYRGTSSGGGYSTVGDLLRFANALLSHKLLKADSTELLLQGKVQGAGVRYAFGFEDERDKDENGWVGHNGGAAGMNGDLRIYPKSGYVVAALANMDPPAAQRITDFVDPRLPK